MNRRAIVLFGEDLPAAVAAQLDAGEGATAWVIDIDHGRVVAASGPGAALLGLGPEAGAGADSARSPLVFDAAMPALVRLRAVAASGEAPSGAGPEPLLFWTPNGAQRLSCRFRFARAGARTFAVVRLDAAPADAESRAGAPASVFSGDDAAKLREIGRRIREGQAARGLKGGPATSAVLPAAAALHAGPSGLEASPAARARLAHELKTPLSAIAAAAEIMKEQRFGPLGGARYVGYAADILASAQHVIHLIDRMLAEAAGADPDSLAGKLEFAEIDAGALLEATVSQLTPLAERAGLSLSLERSSRLPHVVADATSLRQIVFNLLTNALKFTGRGGSVTVAARYEADGPFTIAISDTGPGIGSRAGGAGLGLGLPIAQMLAEANGAELVIESEAGRGTSASVVFRKDRVIPI
jgi:two-component system cell cycle sensor histidine kinase PleC